MKDYKGDYYFNSREEAYKYAIINNWPTDRIIEYNRGFAIQIYISGPYVGPEEINKREKG